MGPSVLQVQREARRSAGGSAAGDIGRAWRASGTGGVVGDVVAVVACVAVTTWWVPTTTRVLGTAVTLLALSAAALVDAVEHRLPNRIVAAALVPVVVTLGVAWTRDVVTSVVLGACLVGVPLLLTHLVTPVGMGFGDVKAGFVLGAAMGLVDGQLGLFALVLGLAGGAAWGVGHRARSIPLGPALVAGALAALAVGRLLGMPAAATNEPRDLLVAEIQAVLIG